MTVKCRFYALLATENADHHFSWLKNDCIRDKERRKEENVPVMFASSRLGLACHIYEARSMRRGSLQQLLELEFAFDPGQLVYDCSCNSSFASSAIEEV
jgi:hypothetical protein